MRVLVGDLGGTHLRLAIAERDGEAWRLTAERNVPSHHLPGLLPAIRDFLADGERPPCACIGVPGPVEGGRAHLSNLSWTVDADELARGTGIERVRIINDFEAVGYAVPALGPDDLVEIQPGVPSTFRGVAPVAVIGPGTGLGQVFLLWEDGRYRPQASEGGHADFAPSEPVEYELHAHLKRLHGHVSAERIVSGPGLVATYAFLAARAGHPMHPDVAQALGAGDAAAAISRLALGGGDPTSGAALALMVRTLARQAASFALSVRATGGVYIAGGIAPKVLPALRDPSFIETFLAKGRMSALLAAVPVRVVIAAHVGLLGAAVAAEDL
ncbi:MAG: glucokinase [Gemmatimonadota bacterium]|nr:glucokinase [Gemmatimonadota bacterium]MDH4350903.1 glucokinase [Gemmatimonadota bacterium]